MKNIATLTALFTFLALTTLMGLVCIMFAINLMLSGHLMLIMASVLALGCAGMAFQPAGLTAILILEKMNK